MLNQPLFECFPAEKKIRKNSFGKNKCQTKTPEGDFSATEANGKK